ncbi:MAG: carboxypeptidase regulatory-like domain-containing protein [Pirellulales bacterium]|nr:carboxypeptidase regulatory-like domain-containing protein [Pirellulales bacterium]
MRHLACIAALLACCFSAGFDGGSAQPARAAETAILSAENFAELAPAGKEVDCIYGDVVLRNDRIIAVVARAGADRHANLRHRNIGGSLIDLTERHKPSDQFGVLYPLPSWKVEFVAIRVDGREVAGAATEIAAGERVELEFRGVPRSPADPSAAVPAATAKLVYALADGDEALSIATTFSNEGDAPVELRGLEGDPVRLDGEFELGIDKDLRLFWGVDRFWRQAYGVLPERATPSVSKQSIERGRPFVRIAPRAAATLAAGESRTVKRVVFPAADLVGVKALAARLQGKQLAAATVRVVDPQGPVADAELVVRVAERSDVYGYATADAAGTAILLLPPGTYDVAARHDARGETTVRLLAGGDSPIETTALLPAAAYVVGELTDGQGAPIACKIDIARVDGGPAPNFGPDSAVYGVRNLVYTPDGKFRVAVRPGEYDLLASHGPEYDAENVRITATAGEETTVALELVRSVDTTGWVSAEFHSHSSPSGDNTSSQLGRVLNLLAEHLEFAPCTEHARITSYDVHLETLGATERMATCPGMELTGQPLPLNHQNAFPLVHHEHAQNGGGPETHPDPVQQIMRIAMWDDGSDKLVQTNHPNIPQMLADRDLDGKGDGGFAEMFNWMDVIEVHPPYDIFKRPESLPTLPRERGNTMFHWLQLLNQGRRVPGVVNTDAHWNFHGSGWLRNFVKSSQDDPAHIDVMEMVHESEHGHVVMSNGPFLQVTASAAGADGSRRTVDVGDDLEAPQGKAEIAVRVQCPNWHDVNRVQVFVNGRPDPELNFTRRTHREMFGDGPVKFDQTIELQLESDAHVVVATIGEGLQLGRVYGPDQGQAPPTAVANPVFVDVDGNGFRANGDQLGLPLPLPESEPGENESAGRRHSHPLGHVHSHPH